MRLGIDLDGVVADFNSGWINRYNSEFDSDVAFDAVRAWNAIPSLTHFRHMGEFWKWARDHDGHSLFRHLEPYEDAVETLWDLTRRHHEIVILTTKPHWAIHDTFAWLSEHRIPTREVHILDHKWSVDCDVYLEDAPHNLRKMVEHLPDRTVCRFVRPWNTEVPGAVDVHGWSEFREVVDSVGSRR